MKRPPWLGRVVRVTLLLAALAVGGVALADRWSEVRSHLDRVGPGPVVAAFAFISVAEFAAMMSWRALLVDLGSRLPVRGAGRIVWLSGLGKYLPGSVWPYLAQVEMGRRYHVPRSRSAAVSIMAVLISLVSALVLAAATMPWTSPAATRRFWPVFLAVPVVAALLHPAVLNRVLSTALRLLRRPPLEERVSLRGIATSAGWSGLAWVVSGLQIWALSDSMASLGAADTLVCIGAYALAWSAGFLFVVAPAGAGVREAAMTAALSPIMPTSAALTVALLSRAVTTAGDVAAAAVAGLLRSGRPDEEPARGPDDPDDPDEGPVEAVEDPAAGAL